MLAILFICAWIVMILGFIYSIYLAFKEGKSQIHKLHQIPCYGCDFFTKNYQLKCTVHPTIACTEEALGCHDFEPKNPNREIYYQKNITKLLR